MRIELCLFDSTSQVRSVTLFITVNVKMVYKFSKIDPLASWYWYPSLDQVTDWQTNICQGLESTCAHMYRDILAQFFDKYSE